ncbi:MAG: hypothetical protein K2L45_06625 [Muribaculaceae bacterium]|nr:hypothetical protein [Muribaculaceae bacterium]
MINLQFDGYWENINDLPTYTGIYTVCAVSGYKCVARSRILYIGKTDNIKDRHYKGHEHLYDFLDHLHIGERLAYTAAPVDGRELSKVENALVYMQQPPINDGLTESYNHEADEFKINGVGSDDFKHDHFGFSTDNDCDSFYPIEDEEL